MVARCKDGKKQRQSEPSTALLFQQREAVVRKKTRLGVLDLMADLLNDLEKVPRQFPKPFGLADDILWPGDLHSEVVHDNDVF